MTDQTDELSTIAVEAYIYLYPLVTMELTRRQTTNLPLGAKPMTAPMNQFVHIRAFPDADFKIVVRPNFDTLYSAAFIDITEEPVVMSAPDTHGRYYMLPLLDMWTDVFANPGSRTTGTGAGAWALVNPGWAGELPAGVDRIEAPTPHMWLIGRTQTNGPADYAAVHQVQDGYGLCRLSDWGSDSPRPLPEVVTDPSIDMDTPTLDQVNALSGADFFTLGAELLKLHKPHLADWSQVARLARIGLVPGESFDAASAPAGVAAAIAAAPAAALSSLLGQTSTMAAVTNGWQMNTNSMGVYGNYYAKRAIVSMVGLGANPPEDAVYPLLQTDADGDAPDGGTAYVLHFDAAALPPANAFWSVTMYDAHGFQVPNEIDRFAIGDRDDLEYNADGSLDLYIQPTNPGPERVSNWLPSVAGRSGITMRLYDPAPSVLSSQWAPPPLRKA